MDKVERKAKLREAVVRHLEGKGYTVRDLSSGSGVPKFSRLEIADGKRKLLCAVKITTTSQGRISFTRNSDGSYKVLSDSDMVVYVCPFADDDTKAVITMFDAVAVREAFDTNFRARKGTDQEELPMWLSPELEAGQRFVGSGFQEKALWSEVTSLSNQVSDLAATDQPRTFQSPSVEGGGGAMGMMDRIKVMLAEHMGVRPDQLEIDVRVKL